MLLVLSGIVHALFFIGVVVLVLFLASAFGVAGGLLELPPGGTLLVLGMPVLGVVQAIWSGRASVRLVIVALVIAAVDVWVAAKQFGSIREIALCFAVVQCALAAFSFPWDARQRGAEVLG